MKIYLIAGEASGDLHGSNLVKALKELHPEIEFRGWGGDLMATQGVQLVKHIRDLAFMGFTEVIRNLPTIFSNLSLCKADLDEWKPDAIIFIDYPGFNLRICSWAKGQGFRTIYYISPQLWAWKESRVKIVRRSVDLMLVILPFEKPFYAKHGIDVIYVGHPLLDALPVGLPQKFRKDQIALLPGSRVQEIKATLPIMLRAASQVEELKAVVAQAPSIESGVYSEVAGNADFELLKGQTHKLIGESRLAAVTSGTATLETAILDTPQAVCYRAGAVSVWLARRLINVKYISLVNLVLDRPLVPELIQDDLSPASLAANLRRLEDGQNREDMLDGYAELRELLGGSGASKRAAEEILERVL